MPIGDHQAGVLESYHDAKGVVTLAASLPNAYAETDSLAKAAERFGKEGVAKFRCNKFPTKVSARSRDMGEILATAYLHDECGYVVGPSRLIQRDHQECAMRGDDVLGARLDSSARLRTTKAEAKSRATLGEAMVKAAREGLARNAELPSPHSLTQFAERLLPTADSDIGEAVPRRRSRSSQGPSRHSASASLSLSLSLSLSTAAWGSATSTRTRFRSSEIVVATPEKLDFALRSDPSVLDDVGLVILDEGHMIGASEREVRYEAQIPRLIRPDASTRRILCLSAAFPPGPSSTTSSLGSPTTTPRGLAPDAATFRPCRVARRARTTDHHLRA